MKSLVAILILIYPSFNYSQAAFIESTADNTIRELLSGSSTSSESKKTTYSYGAVVQSKLSHYKPVKLQDEINSNTPEMGPVISPDGKKLFFSRYNHGKDGYVENDEEDIWIANWDESTNNWAEPTKMDAPFNNEFPNYINSISSDGTALLLGNVYLKNGNMKEGLSISRKTEEGWSFPVPIKIESGRKIKNWTGCFLSNDEKILIISSEGDKGVNSNSDLFICFKKTGKYYSRPVKLNNINTSYDELSPFLSSDGKTLFFSSDGHPGNGKHDIFMTNRLDETYLNWSDPVNLGDKINGPGNECFFSISPIDSSIYYVSDSNMEGDLDIYVIRNTSNILKSDLSPTDKEETHIDIEQFASEFTTRELNDMLVPIYFDSNSHKLDQSDDYSINCIATLLSDYPEKQILIIGNTDSIGQIEFNIELSFNRALAVARALEYEGIDESRITIMGFGESNPVESNNSVEGRAKNRRVEFIISER